MAAEELVRLPAAELVGLPAAYQDGGMAKQRGYPDRRGMGAQSDFISETFAPSESFRATQLAMARCLPGQGISPRDVGHMLSISVDLLPLDLLRIEGNDQNY